MLSVWPWIDSAERGVLPRTQGLLQSYFFLGTNCMLFFADIGENGFGHRSVVPKILKSLMLQRPGNKKQQLTCKHEMQSLALQLIPQLLLKSCVVL